MPLLSRVSHSKASRLLPRVIALGSGLPWAVHDALVALKTRKGLLFGKLFFRYLEDWYITVWPSGCVLCPVVPLKGVLGICRWKACWNSILVLAGWKEPSQVQFHPFIHAVFREGSLKQIITRTITRFHLREERGWNGKLENESYLELSYSLKLSCVICVSPDCWAMFQN